MVITIEYKDGRVKEFNTSSFTSSDPWRDKLPKARNYVTEFDLRCDLLDYGATEMPKRQPAQKIGLRLDVYYNTLGEEEHRQTQVEELNTKSPVANHWLAGSINLANADEIPIIASVTCETCGKAEVVAWRQGMGDWLINGGRFRAMQRMCYTDGNVSSVNTQAVMIADYLTKARPDLDVSQVAEAMGFPLEAYFDAVRSEAAALKDDVDPDGDDDGPDDGPSADDLPEPPGDDDGIELDLDQEFDEDE